MRRAALLALIAPLAVAAPAMAQVTAPYSPLPPPDPGILVQQEQMRQQLIQQQAQIQALEAQLRAQQGIQELNRLRTTPPIPQPYIKGSNVAKIDTSKLASIPDAALADSNKKVLDAANNRH